MNFLRILVLFLSAVLVATPLSGAVYTVTSGGNSGPGTLYEALQSANLHIGPDTINFDISGTTSPYHLPTAIRLPSLTDNGTFINGYSQEGSKPSTGGFGESDNAVILLLMDGAQVDSQYAGLTIESDSNEICGLIISRINGSDITSGGSGILVNKGSYNHIWGCWFGLDSTGTVDWGSRQAGIVLRAGASHNLIGGMTPAERNVISGNNVTQIAVLDRGTDYNEIVGNYIGTEKSGTLKPANLSASGYGIFIEGDAADAPEMTFIGGADSLFCNVISANPQDGIHCKSHLIPAGFIKNNRIGVNSEGNALGNEGVGVYLSQNVAYDTISFNWIAFNGSHGVSINDTSPNHILITDNLIADNNGNGVNISGFVTDCWIENCEINRNTGAGVFMAGPQSDFNTVTKNSIYDNDGIGIDLAPEGVNLNDGSDIDEGANDQMNYPIIDSVSTTRAYGHIEGYSRRSASVEIYVASVDPSNYGEGKTFAGKGVSDSDGKFAIITTSVVVGDYVTATVTDTAGNTSEFSKNIRVLKAGPGVEEVSVLVKALLDVKVSSTSLEIIYSFPVQSDLRLSLYDASGRMVRENFLKVREQGLHKLVWDASDISAGIYFVKLESSDKVLMRKAVVVH